MACNTILNRKVILASLLAIGVAGSGQAQGVGNVVGGGGASISGGGEDITLTYSSGGAGGGARYEQLGRSVTFASNSGGMPMCVTSGSWTFRNGSTGQAMLKWSSDLGLFVHISKSNWRFGTDIEIPLSITFDGGARDGTGTSVVSASGTSMIEVHINGTGEHFVRDFADANRMVIAFKSGNEPQWEAQMQGSREAAIVLLKCIGYIKNNGGAATSPVPQASSPVAPPATSPVGPKPTTPTPARRRDDGSV